MDEHNERPIYFICEANRPRLDNFGVEHLDHPLVIEVVWWYMPKNNIVTPLLFIRHATQLDCTKNQLHRVNFTVSVALFQCISLCRSQLVESLRTVQRHYLDVEDVFIRHVVEEIASKGENQLLMLSEASLRKQTTKFWCHNEVQLHPV